MIDFEGLGLNNEVNGCHVHPPLAVARVFYCEEI